MKTEKTLREEAEELERQVEADMKLLRGFGAYKRDMDPFPIGLFIFLIALFIGIEWCNQQIQRAQAEQIRVLRNSNDWLWKQREIDLGIQQ